MKFLLDSEGREALRAFAVPGTLVAFDYDGTLAGIAAHPDQAFMRPRTLQLLRRVALRYPTVVLTGRARADALRLLGGVGGIEVIGNHGSETAQGGGPDAARVAEWKRHLHGALAGLDGVHVEDKGYSLSVHYRQAADVRGADAAVWRAAAQLADARLVGGKCVVNIVARDAPTKSSALALEAARVGALRSIFAGDDVTDEDVFAGAAPDRVLTVRIEPSIDSKAAYYLECQEQIDDLLELLDAGPP